jgi:hypothetical protein
MSILVHVSNYPGHIIPQTSNFLGVRLSDHPLKTSSVCIRTQLNQKKCRSSALLLLLLRPTGHELCGRRLAFDQSCQVNLALYLFTTVCVACACSQQCDSCSQSKSLRNAKNLIWQAIAATTTVRLLVPRAGIPRRRRIL